MKIIRVKALPGKIQSGYYHHFDVSVKKVGRRKIEVTDVQGTETFYLNNSNKRIGKNFSCVPTTVPYMYFDCGMQSVFGVYYDGNYYERSY